MPRLHIDGREVEVPEGGTVLDAARQLGVDIPALCYRPGHPPATACMLCVVRAEGSDRLVPSCATKAEEGMRIESETAEIRRIRKIGLELLLSNHVGDCVAPCQSTCPAHLDIPLMLRQVAAGRFDEAIVTVKRDIALPAVLGRICPEPCERACHRSHLDSAPAICLIKRLVADLDLASASPYLPPCKPSSGKKIAIVGAGPAGLTAAYHLLQEGHDCTLFDRRNEPGGTLRTRFDADELPQSVVDAEIAVIERMGAVFHLNTEVNGKKQLADLRAEYDAVLIATGAPKPDEDGSAGAPVGVGVTVNAENHETDQPGVFAAGEIRHSSKLVIRTLADAKAAVASICQYLRGDPVTGSRAIYNVRAGRLAEEEIEQLAAGSNRSGRAAEGQDLTEEQARTEAARCLHCDCGKPNDCRLRRYAEAYGVKGKRFSGYRQKLQRHAQHGDVIYEPGKCILCGLCVRIAAEAGEDIGLTFIGRGFDVRVGVPLNKSMAEALAKTARQCVEACPTGALVLKNAKPPQEKEEQR